jgi:hypothetical protein
MVMLKNSHNVAVFDLTKITAQHFMEYVSAQANQKIRKPLSKAGYGSKQTAFFHLILVHNGMGPDAVFDAELKTLWKGFTRQTIQQKLWAAPAPRNPTPADVESNSDVDDKHMGDKEQYNDTDIEAEEDDERDEFKQAKEPMSPELFRKICSWLMAWGTVDGIFALCFLVHTWNLACCQGHNTARIRFSHMSWNTFDATQMNFKHTKTDKLDGGMVV